jgi:hypothetical protein
MGARASAQRVLEIRSRLGDIEIQKISPTKAKVDKAYRSV